MWDGYNFQQLRAAILALSCATGSFWGRRNGAADLPKDQWLPITVEARRRINDRMILPTVLRGLGR
jgi:hypothetical protein